MNVISHLLDMDTNAFALKSHYYQMNSIFFFFALYSKETLTACNAELPAARLWHSWDQLARAPTMC